MFCATSLSSPRLTLQTDIEKLFDEKPEAYSEADFRLFQTFKDALNSGAVRAAEPDPSARSGWRVNSWVKKGILLGFRMGALVDISVNRERQPYFDKATYPVKRVTVEGAVRADRASATAVMWLAG